MLDELLCLNRVGDKTTISLSKILARLTYLGVGFGASIGVKYVLNAKSK